MTPYSMDTKEILDFRFWNLDYRNRKSKIPNPKYTRDTSIYRLIISVLALGVAGAPLVGAEQPAPDLQAGKTAYMQ